MRIIYRFKTIISKAFLLETWEAATNYYLSHLSATNVRTMEIAELLGWVRKRTENGDERIQLNNTAKAASGTLNLINEGYHTQKRPLIETVTFDEIHLKNL
jgi:hypothetical protein